MRPGTGAPAVVDRGEGSSSGGGGGGTSGGAAGTAGAAIAADPVAAPSSSSLAEMIRVPAPDIRIIGAIPDDWNKKEYLDPKEDLWLSTYDGRYNSDIIPILVGSYPDAKTFTVHKRVLEKTEWFRKALSGPFLESKTQSLTLPEEQPAIFHHLVTFLYEGRYEPIKPIASELIPDPDKGKGLETAADGDDDSMSDSDRSLPSDSTARSRRRRDRRRRREDRVYERLRQKHPGAHRPSCQCPQCYSAGNSAPCWNCGQSRFPPPPLPPMPYGPADHRDPYGAHVVAAGRADRSRRRLGPHPMGGAGPPRRAGPLAAPGPGPGPGVPGPPGFPGPPTAAAGAAGAQAQGGQLVHVFHDPNSDRIKGEDMRTWLLAYELNIDVYICAHRFLMDDFKRAVSRACIDMLETAGADAAQPRVLQLCRRLYDGLGSEADPLLRMVFARVGFLQPVLARGWPDETHEFLVSNPDVAALVLRETTCRREEDVRNLPCMERHTYAAPPVDLFGGGPPRHAPPHRNQNRWYY